jgi:hypothetical protein
MKTVSLLSKLWFILWLALLSVQTTQAVTNNDCSATNLLLNPDFEVTGDNHRSIPNWGNFVAYGVGELTQDSNAISGQHAARLQNFGEAKTAIFQGVDLPAGRYRVSADVASWGMQSGEYGNTAHFYMELPQGNIFFRVATDDQDWRTMVGEFELNQATRVPFYFLIYGTGYLWVDNMELQRADSCNTAVDIGFSMNEEVLQPLVFEPPLQEEDLLLKGYCDDANFAQTPVCQRIASVNLDNFNQVTESQPRTIAQFDPARVVDKANTSYIVIHEHVNMPTDWTGYDYIDFTVNNPDRDNANGAFVISDTQSYGYWSRVNWYVTFAPGKRTIRIPLQVFVGEKSVILERRRLDIANITGLFLDMSKGQIEIEEVTLSSEKPYEHDFDKLLKLDMGKETSPVFYGFTPFTSSSAYRDNKGYGLTTDSDIRRSEDRRHPESLLRDWISIADGEIKVDLPNGDYHVWMMMEDPGYWEYYQSYDYRFVAAEGEKKYEDTMTINAFWAKYFAYENTEDFPNDNIWERYIKQRYQPIEFTVTVNDGQLNLDFGAGNYSTYANTLSALLIWPESQNAQGQAFIDELWGKLEGQYGFEYGELLPALPDHAVPDASAQALGDKVLIYQRPFDQDVQATDWPSEQELVNDLSLQLALDEYEPLTVSLYAKQATQLTDAQLELDGLEIDAYKVRYKLQRISLAEENYENVPSLLDDLQFPLDLSANQSRRLWFTVHAPRDFTETEVQGSLTLSFADGTQQRLPVTVQVLSYVLPPADVPIGYLGVAPKYTGSAFPDEIKAKQGADIQPSLELLKKHGMTAITGGVGGPQFLGYNGNQVNVDFTNADKIMTPAAADFKYPVHTYGAMTPTGLGLERYQMYDMSAHGGRSFTNVLRDVNESIKQHGSAYDWSEIIYTVGDEPSSGQIESTKQLATAVRNAGARSSIFTSFTSASEDKAIFADYIDILLLTIHNEAAMQHIINRGAICGTYNFFNSRFARGLYQYKLHRFGCQGGYYQFMFNAVHIDPYYGLDGREDELVAVLPTSTNGKLIAKLDMERFREAVDDYRYLHALEELITNASASVEKSAAETWLNDTLNSISIDHTAMRNWDESQIHQIRQQAVEHSMRLMGVDGYTPPENGDHTDSDNGDSDNSGDDNTNNDSGNSDHSGNDNPDNNTGDDSDNSSDNGNSNTSNEHSIIISANANVLTGTNGSDPITTIGESYVMVLKDGNDFAWALEGGRDVFIGGAGNDYLDGNRDEDAAVYTGRYEDYSINPYGSGWQVIDNREGNPDGTDSVFNVEQLQFLDGLYLVESKTFKADVYIDEITYEGISTDNGNTGDTGNNDDSNDQTNDDDSTIVVGSGTLRISEGFEVFEGTDAGEQSITINETKVMNLKGGNDYAWTLEHGRDVFIGGVGNDYLDGNKDDDAAVYSGRYEDYSINKYDVGWQVIDNREGSPDGTDSVFNVQQLQFRDGIYLTVTGEFQAGKVIDEVHY